MKERRMKDLCKTMDDLKREKQQLVKQHHLVITTKNRELKDAASQRDNAESYL